MVWVSETKKNAEKKVYTIFQNMSPISNQLKLNILHNIIEIGHNRQKKQFPVVIQ